MERSISIMKHLDRHNSQINNQAAKIHNPGTIPKPGEATRPVFRHKCEEKRINDVLCGEIHGNLLILQPCWPYSLMDRISESGSDGCGSIPHGATKLSCLAWTSRNKIHIFSYFSLICGIFE